MDMGPGVRCYTQSKAQRKNSYFERSDYIKLFILSSTVGVSTCGLYILYTGWQPFTPTWEVVSDSTSSYLNIRRFNRKNIKNPISILEIIVKIEARLHFPLSSYWTVITA